MWVLVLVVLEFDSVSAERIGQYPEMAQCFEGRAELLSQYGRSEYFPESIQAICIRQSASEQI